MTDFTTETEQMDKEDRADKATEQVLYDLTGVYSRKNRNIPVKMGNRSYIATDGSFISISEHFGADLTGPQRFRMQSDTASHETWHDNESDLESKKTFSEENDIAPYTAGVVINVVEDHYIDFRRTMDFPGQKKSLAHKLKVQMYHAPNPKFDAIDEQSNRGKELVNGLLQVSSLGFPLFENKDDVDDDVLDFLTWVRPRVKEVREMTPENEMDMASKDLSYEEAQSRAQRKRRELSQEIFEVLIGHLDDPSDADDYVKNSQPFSIPNEIPDDVETRPMTDEEKEKFEKMKQDMPSMSGDGEDGEDGDEGESQDGQPSSAGSGGGSGGEQSDDGDDAAGDDQQDGDANSSEDGDDGESDGDEQGAGGSGDDQSEDEDGDSEMADDGAGDSDDMTCSDCGTELITMPREEAENQNGLMDSLRTDGGQDMVHVCPDCGQMVDPETGEHQGSGDDNTDDSADGDEQDADGAGDEQSDDGDEQASGDDGDGQQDGDESGQGDSDSDDDGDEGDGADDGDAGSDDGNGDDSDGADDGDENGQDGQSNGDGTGDSDDEGDEQDGGGRQDPFSENDGTDYDDDRHDVRQYRSDELARERDDMMTLAKHDNVAGNYGVDDTDISEVEERFVRRYQKIKLAKKSDDDSMYVRQMARDERVQNNVAAVPSEQIRQEVMDGDLKDEIEKAFRELKTRNRYVEAEVGEDLNMDGVITNRAMGTEVRSNYKHMQRAEKGDRAVGVALDMSGSMNEEKAKVAIGALYAATEIIGDSFVASAFMTSSTGGRRSSGNIYTPLITGPSEDFSWSHLDGLTTDDMTPTASGIIDGTGLLEKASRPEKVLVVVTDGKPNRAPDGNNNGNKALDSAASAVQRARSRGIKVIGLAVGSSINAGNMQAMFGRNGEGYFRTDDDNLADTLLSIYRQQMSLVQEGAV